MPDRIAALTEKMAASRAGLLRAADSVSAEGWKTKPTETSWSAAELVAHLVTVERGVLGKADRIAQKPPKPIPLLKRFHLPITLVKTRVVKRESPVPVAPEMIRDKEEMLAQLREVRERTMAFLAETSNRDLTDYRWSHPALGMLNTYQWIQFLAAHEVRHTKQMQEISGNLLNLNKGNLLKPIGNSQK